MLLKLLISNQKSLWNSFIFQAISMQFNVAMWPRCLWRICFWRAWWNLLDSTTKLYLLNLFWLSQTGIKLFHLNYGISDLGLTLPHFEFLSLYLVMFDQNLHFLCFNFNQTYLKTGLKTQNGEELSLDLIFLNNFGKISKKIVTQLQVKNSL